MAEIDFTKWQKANLSLLKAIELFEKQADKSTDEALAFRDSAIQRFEYTFELSWKTLKRWMKYNADPAGAEVKYSIREIFRIAGRDGIIEDPERWIDYHKARNLTSHVYDEETAGQVYAQAKLLARDVTNLIELLNKIQ